VFGMDANLHHLLIRIVISIYSVKYSLYCLVFIHAFLKIHGIDIYSVKNIEALSVSFHLWVYNNVSQRGACKG